MSLLIALLLLLVFVSFMGTGTACFVLFEMFFLKSKILYDGLYAKFKLFSGQLLLDYFSLLFVQLPIHV